MPLKVRASTAGARNKRKATVKIEEKYSDSTQHFALNSIHKNYYQFNKILIYKLENVTSVKNI